MKPVPISSSIITVIFQGRRPERLDTRFLSLPHSGEPSSEPAPPIEMEGADDILDLFAKIYKASEEQKKKKEKREKKKAVAQGTEKNSPAEHINLRREYVFPSLDTVIEAAHGLNNFFQGFNSLYKDERADTILCSFFIRIRPRRVSTVFAICFPNMATAKSCHLPEKHFLQNTRGCILSAEALQSGH